MDLFTGLMAALLGPEHEIAVETGADGVPRVRLEMGGVLCLEPDAVVIEDLEDDDRVEAIAMALGAAGPRLRRVCDFSARFPYALDAGGDRVVCTLEPPVFGDVLDAEGLHGQLRIIGYTGDTLSNVMESECVVVSAAALDAPWADWTALLSAYDARRATWAEQMPELYPEDVLLEAPSSAEAPEDAGWEAYAEALSLSPESLDALALPCVDAAFAALPDVRARYREVYGLELPSGLAVLAALVDALGALPENPSRCFWTPAPGRARGGAWLDAALSMRPSGLSTWFAPGALARPPLDAADVYAEVPPGREGPLDARLDMRYRCDAPQFVTFLGGDSDGLHWGFWYDSPAHFPVIAHNYARDSAETWLDGLADVPAFLRRALATETVRALEEVASETPEGEDEIGYATARWRALRVVGGVLDAVEAMASPHLSEADAEVGCPWPRTEGHPTGSPALALPPEAGVVPRQVVGYPGTDDAATPETRAAWIAEARAELAAGRPAYAQALGLYLHWLDADDTREAGGALLMDAYVARGFDAFAGILRVHLAHRDLPSVGVLRED